MRPGSETAVLATYFLAGQGKPNKEVKKRAVKRLMANYNNAVHVGVETTLCDSAGL